jgi:hypothetical protein
MTYVVGLYLNPPQEAIVLLRKREEPDSGAGSHAAGIADQEGPMP